MLREGLFIGVLIGICFCGTHGQLCDRLEHPVNGKVVSNPTNKVKFIDEDTVRIVCDSGYVPEEDESICIGGIWTNEPVCTITCPALPPPINGEYIPSQRNQTIWNIDDIARFVCLEGYIAVGVQVSLCLPSGQWSREEPICKGKSSCLNRPPPPNGHYYQGHQKKWYAGDIAKFRCQFTHQLIGSDTSTCQSDGEWSTDLPICTEKETCASRPAPANGAYDTVVKKVWRVGARAIFRCDLNFPMLGSRSSTCLKTGKWSADVPSCQVIQRDVPDFPSTCERPKTLKENVYFVPDDKEIFQSGESVSITCGIGISSGQEGVAICLEGEWLGLPPCLLNQCKHREAPKNGDYVQVQREKTTWYVGDIAKFECDSDTTLGGSSESKCDENGAWSSPVPTCDFEKGTRCVNRDPPLNGAYVEGQQNKTKWVPGDIAVFMCSPGYLAIGVQVALCERNGKWSRRIPTCQEKPKCEYRDPPIHGYYSRRQKKDWYVGDVAFFHCDITYKLVGDIMTTCLWDGTWSTDVPECRGIKFRR